jgi:hypothetical protein
LSSFPIAPQKCVELFQQLTNVGGFSTVKTRAKIVPMPCLSSEKIFFFCIF